MSSDREQVLHHMWVDETGRWREVTLRNYLLPATAELIADAYAARGDRTVPGASSPNDDR